MKTTIFAALFGATVLGGANAASIGADSGCYCLPEDDCWPSPAQWDALNTTVYGRLIATVPVGSVCHDPMYNEAACEALMANWTEPDVQYVVSLSSLDITCAFALPCAVRVARHRERHILYYQIRDKN
jgi:hypothetical protein